MIDGIVTDTNLVTLSGATVSILGSSLSVPTGDNGRFRIAGLHAGNYILTVHRIGYVPIAVATTVADGDTLRPSFALQRIVSALDTMIVTAKSLATRMSEFEDRRKLGFGHFITAEDIEKRNATFLADVIRTVLSVGISERTPGVQIAYNMRGMGGCLPGLSRRHSDADSDEPRPAATAQGSGGHRDLFRSGDHSAAIQVRQCKLRRHVALDEGWRMSGYTFRRRRSRTSTRL